VVSACNLRVCLASQRKGNQSCRAAELELSSPRRAESIELSHLHIGPPAEELKSSTGQLDGDVFEASPDKTANLSI
jgi:hypothetical protein